MRSQKIFCIAALVLMAASLMVVALDHSIFPGTRHTLDNCPICNLASSLASSVLPVLVLPIEVTARSWMPQEPPVIFCTESPHWPFSARDPPLLPTA